MTGGRRGRAAGGAWAAWVACWLALAGVAAGATGVFWSADDAAVALKEVRGADGRTVEVGLALPARIGGETGVAGEFPGGERLLFRFGAAGDDANDRVLAWTFGGEDATAWFVLHAGNEEVPDTTVTWVENRGEVAARADVEFGGRRVGAGIPPGGTVHLCLVLPPGAAPRFRAAADAEQTEHPADWNVQLGTDPRTGAVVVKSGRKAYPELVLHNTESAAADVEVWAEDGAGGFARKCKVRLKAGETGYALPVPPHKALDVRWRFRGKGLGSGQAALEATGFGERRRVVVGGGEESGVRSPESGGR